MRGVAIAVLLTGGLITTLAACRQATTGPAVDDAGKPYVQALSKRLEGRDLPPILTPDQEHCVAASIVDGIGVEVLQSAGITADDVAESRIADLAPAIGTAQRAEAVASSIVGCKVGGKFAGLFASRELAHPDSLEVQKVIDCIGTDVGDSEAADIIAAYFFGRPSDQASAEVREMLVECGFATR